MEATKSKKFRAALALILVLSQSVQAAFADDADTGATDGVRIEERPFTVTAYYSPLPDQSHYLKGSYEEDLRLNGNGTHGASGKPVYPGMLAAPKTYPFGTVINLPGIGTGTVDDRGGAIVLAGERGQQCDRIDVWMGYGETGLARALAWGRRTVNGKVYYGLDAEDATVSVKLAKMPTVSLAALEPKPIEDRVFTEPIGPNSSSGMIRALSERLLAVGYLGSRRDAFDPELRFALIRFQTDRNLIKGPKDSNAGYYGPTTRKALQTAYQSFLSDKAATDKEIADILSTTVARAKFESNQSRKISQALDTVGTPKDGEVGSHIRTLQDMLSSIGYLDRKSTGIFGTKTKAAIAKFQLDSGLVVSLSDPNAGKLGKLTKAKLLSALVKAAPKG
jgi:peptidoglycan hydrolase-like protein with peptidoglycan-binding domain/3D (Asp-Asp-Asp) domain-containing protein